MGNEGVLMKEILSVGCLCGHVVGQSVEAMLQARTSSAEEVTGFN
jgi:hypothetical protein